MPDIWPVPSWLPGSELDIRSVSKYKKAGYPVNFTIFPRGKLRYLVLLAKILSSGTKRDNINHLIDKNEIKWIHE